VQQRSRISRLLVMVFNSLCVAMVLDFLFLGDGLSIPSTKRQSRHCEVYLQFKALHSDGVFTLKRVVKNVVRV